MHFRGLVAALVAGISTLAPAVATAHWLDHPAPPPGSVPAPASTFNSGGPGAEWELIDTITTGNPHTDLDFFTQNGETYASVGTLGSGPNGGGQTIVQLTKAGAVDPELIAQHPSASCISDPSAATGLQHDVEASPKGNAILNVTNPYAVRTDTQIIIDATDAEGRCHDQGVLGLEEAKQGGLEIVDVTDPAAPVEIGLTSHIGEAHTVNVDPKRPHIAYAVTSDSITVTDGKRQNEVEDSSDSLDLDGFEVVDLSSCMNFPAGTTVDQKRAACLPQVYRYRYPSLAMALGHTVKTGSSAEFGCHELEIYPDDRLTCASGNALIELDMSGAFDDMGTPTDFSDDKPRGTPLACSVRESSTVGPTTTGAQVTDCVDGPGDGETDLDVPGWLAAGAPSLEGVEWIGSVIHQGGGPGQTSLPPLDSTQDIAFDHEAELSGSGGTLIATDERGGGLIPPGAACDPADANVRGNGGLHFYDPDKLTRSDLTPTEEEAHKSYKRTPEGDLAIYRAEIRTQPEGSFCTAHVFEQIPGENRIFMGWYSQGTQVVDFVENDDGTIRFAYAGHFIPENADTWVSHVFKTEQNPDGTTTYYGATGDFLLGPVGRNSIDVWKVTLPPAPKSGPFGSGDGGGGGGGGGGSDVAGPCAQKLAGTKSPDSLLGSIAGDRINGRGGDDELRGRAGEDCIRGGGGGDDVRGGGMNDRLNGGRGPDALAGGGGADTVRDRGGGRDRLRGGGGADRLRADGGGTDQVLCGGGRDVATVDEDDRARGCEKLKRR